MKTFEELGYKVVSLSRKELDKLELDNEDDLKDFVSAKLSLESFEEVMSGWDVSGEKYTVVAKV